MGPRRISLLMTRPVEGEILRRAEAAGIDIHVVPFIRTVPLPAARLAAELSVLQLSGLTAVFTSPAAVRAAAPHVQPDQIFCISGATRDAVRQLMPGAVIAGTADTAASLAAVILSKENIPEVRFFCGDLHLPTLPALLESGGIRVMKHLTYRTEHTPVPLEGRFDGICFFSPSAVASYLSLNGIDPGMALFAIGTTTAAALKAPGRQIVTSPAPTAAAMLDIIIQFYQSGHVLTPTNNA